MDRDKKKITIAILIALAIIGVIGGVMYAFGTRVDNKESKKENERPMVTY